MPNIPKMYLKQAKTISKKLLRPDADFSMDNLNDLSFALESAKSTSLSNIGKTHLKKAQKIARALNVPEADTSTDTLEDLMSEISAVDKEMK